MSPPNFGLRKLLSFNLDVPKMLTTGLHNFAFQLKPYTKAEVAKIKKE
jgi:hypothetical protein